mmetsp:Transcript_219/g.322  ORF Transcript_219/g.322 Transcript_219/m.322 type:complete len:765 (-) Transcript_219:2068-4362(-)|eukprot:CAMPEP_0203670748 /NCGR_PEP_ID=MMETSP0090-20130426/6739_1 /ASSEMBLY_ACC=CAM_ASM_001088 /TAXON_ID=426623 /ORGANISM="Chaetoceros affinis, Strain CCMP159" /LENGTH=764 /DNA_ID=CAMNT_0050535677 /DNA_START=67 /DNA_END=2361 /DNA_ORIENTATION=+
MNILSRDDNNAFMPKRSNRAGGFFIGGIRKNRRVLVSKVLPIALIVLCIYNTLENDSLSLDRQLQLDEFSSGSKQKYGPGKYNGRYKFCRTPYVLIDNVMATMPPLVPPEDRIDPPSYIQLCQAFLDRNKLESNELAGMPELKVVEDPAICLDWSAPHYSIMAIFASSLVASKGLDLGLRYNHNCHNFMLKSREDKNTQYDYTTAQQVLTENLISAQDADDVSVGLVESLCHGCISHHNQVQPKPIGGLTHHCFLFPGGQSANVLRENRQELPLSSILSSFVDRLRHLTEDWNDATDALDFEDESGVIVALDEKSSYMETAYYDRVITTTPTSIQIFASVSCAVASVQRTSDCIEHGRSLKAYFKRRFAKSTYVRYDVVASTATSFSRMMSSSILICPPGTVMCLLPALGKLAGKKAYVAEDGSKPATFHWFEDIIEKRKKLGLQRPGYDAVADEDYLIISEEITQEVPEDLPKEDLDRDVPHPPGLDENERHPPANEDIDEDEDEDLTRSQPPHTNVDEIDIPATSTESIETIGEGDQETDQEVIQTEPFEIIDEEDLEVNQETTLTEPTETSTEPFEIIDEEVDQEVTQTEPVEINEQDLATVQVPEAEEHDGSPILLEPDTNLVESDLPSPDQVELMPIFDFWHDGNKDHTFHFGDPWEGEMKGILQYYAYPVQVEGTEPVFSFINEEIMDYTFHFGDPWPDEIKLKIEFYAFPGQVAGLDLQPIYSYWHEGDNSHTFHFGEAWDGEVKEERIVFYAFPPM